MRLFHTGYRRGVREQLSEAIPDLNFDTGRETMYQQLCKSRLCVATFNGTIILETLSENFPTLGFWNFDHWKVCESSLPLFLGSGACGYFS